MELEFWIKFELKCVGSIFSLPPGQTESGWKTFLLLWSTGHKHAAARRGSGGQRSALCDAVFTMWGNPGQNATATAATRSPWRRFNGRRRSAVQTGRALTFDPGVLLRHGVCNRGDTCCGNNFLLGVLKRRWMFVFLLRPRGLWHHQVFSYC